MLQYETGFLLLAGSAISSFHAKYNLYLIQHTNKSLTIFGAARALQPGVAWYFLHVRNEIYEDCSKELRVSHCLFGFCTVQQSCPFGLFMVMLIRCWRLRWVNCESLALRPFIIIIKLIIIFIGFQFVIRVCVF